MTLPLFPDVAGARMSIEPFFASAVEQFGEQSFQCYRGWFSERLTFGLAWDLLDDASADSFESTVLAAIGAATTFAWYFWDSDWYWMWVPLGRGDGVATAFDVPGKVVSNLAVFRDTGVALGVSTLVEGAGANGSARVTLTAAPANGAELWCNFTGRRLFTTSFEKDDNPIDRFVDPKGQSSIQTRIVTAK